MSREQILKILKTNPTGYTASELIDRTGLSDGSIYRQLKNLELDEWIEICSTGSLNVYRIKQYTGNIRTAIMQYLKDGMSASSSQVLNLIPAAIQDQIFTVSNRKHRNNRTYEEIQNLIKSGKLREDNGRYYKIRGAAS